MATLHNVGLGKSQTQNTPRSGSRRPIWKFLTIVPPRSGSLKPISSLSYLRWMTTLHNVGLGKSQTLHTPQSRSRCSTSPLSGPCGEYGNTWVCGDPAIGREVSLWASNSNYRAEAKLQLGTTLWAWNMGLQKISVCPVSVSASIESRPRRDRDLVFSENETETKGKNSKHNTIQLKGTFFHTNYYRHDA